MRRVIASGVLLSGVLVSGLSLAQATSTAKPLSGYACMSLNITDAQAHDFHYHVSFYAKPSLNSDVVGYASSQVAVRAPAHTVDGFTEALFPTGATVWIQSTLLRPYHSALEPTARCVPTILANGRVGFSYPHG
jgi:hypothetical protein